MGKGNRCGGCCWLYGKTLGYGFCANGFGKKNIWDRCEQHVSKMQMRHYLAVLMQFNRYRRDNHVPSYYRMPDPKELGKAIDFSVKYIKTFSEL